MGAGPFARPRGPTESDLHERLTAPIPVLRLFSSDVTATKVTAMTWTTKSLLWLHTGTSGVRPKHRYFFLSPPIDFSVQSGLKSTFPKEEVKDMEELTFHALVKVATLLTPAPTLVSHSAVYQIYSQETVETKRLHDFPKIDRRICGGSGQELGTRGHTRAGRREPSSPCASRAF